MPHGTPPRCANASPVVHLRYVGCLNKRPYPLLHQTVEILFTGLHHHLDYASTIFHEMRSKLHDDLDSIRKDNKIDGTKQNRAKHNKTEQETKRLWRDEAAQGEISPGISVDHFSSNLEYASSITSRAQHERTVQRSLFLLGELWLLSR